MRYMKKEQKEKRKKKVICGKQKSKIERKKRSKNDVKESECENITIDTHTHPTTFKFLI